MNRASNGRTTHTHFHSFKEIFVSNYLVLTGTDTHVAVLSVEGVGEQPQTLCQKLEVRVRSKILNSDRVSQSRK